MYELISIKASNCVHHPSDRGMVFDLMTTSDRPPFILQPFYQPSNDAQLMYIASTAHMRVFDMLL